MKSVFIINTPVSLISSVFVTFLDGPEKYKILTDYNNLLQIKCKTPEKNLFLTPLHTRLHGRNLSATFRLVRFTNT